MNKNNELVSRISLFFEDIKDAITGSDKDFTQIGINRAILILAIPMVLEMMWESVFAIFDILFVARLGSDAVAVVGMTESVNTIIYAIGMGMGYAATSMVSRRIGEKNPEEAGRTAVQAILAASLISVVIGVAGAYFASDILRLMGATEEMANEMSSYTAIMLGSNIVIILLFIINAIFRSSGDAAVAMKVLMLGNGINIILNPCLIFGLGPFPELGITGAAIATATGRGIAVATQLYILFKGKKRVALARRMINVNWQIIRKLISISIPGIAQNLIATASWIFLIRIIAFSGKDAVAGYTIALRIIMFILLPIWGVANATATLVGQNLGAGKPDRSESAVKYIGKMSVILMGIISLPLVIWPSPFIEIFIQEPSVVAYGATALRMISYGFIAYALGIVLINSFNGAGDTRTPAFINLIAFWLVQIPLAWFLSVELDMKEEGVFVAIVFSETILTLIAWILFKRGTWKLKKV